MARIAIVGAGQAGLLSAHALHGQGHEVTLYSERTPEDFLERARPTGTACRFDMALEWERELGLEHWGESAPQIDGVHLTFCQKKGNQFITLLGRFKRTALAIDLRLQSATWLRELDAEGARVEIESVSVARLEEIAAANELTLVAAGRGEIMRLFERDVERSRYTAPQRQLAMVNVTGVAPRMEYAPHMVPVKFNFFAPHGECFWVPWLSKDLKPSWSLVFEAKAGSPIDGFQECSRGEQALARAKETIREMTPWDYEWARDAELCDENSWLVGAFTPEVRHVVGNLPSGRPVMAVGDTAHSLDPIGGQGANNGNKMARTVVEAIAERPDGPFDADWMRAAHQRFWERHRYIEQFNNTLLEPITTPGKMLLVAQYGSSGRPDDTGARQQIADAFVDNFNDPRQMTAAFHDGALARKTIRDAFGSFAWPVARGAFGVARAQVRQLLGRPPGHPGTIG